MASHHPRAKSDAMSRIRAVEKDTMASNIQDLYDPRTCVAR